MSYLIRNGKVIAVTDETLKSGSEVQVAWNTAKENINAAREENLVNPFIATVSNDSKYDTDENNCLKGFATTINNSDNEFNPFK